MLRIGSVFKIKPELKDDYKKDHDEIWPEYKKAIREAGLKNYSLAFANFNQKLCTIFTT